MTITAGLLLLNGCKKEDDPQVSTTSSLNLNISGLEDLGSTQAYEGWIIVNGSAISTGVFTVNSSGVLSKTSFEVGKEDLNNATAFVLTIEPVPDMDPKPSSVHILAGDFSGTSSALTVGHASALGSDFSSAAGTYILATPTDGGGMTDESSGVWWLNPSTGPGAGLSLPTLPAGWKSEGWAVINGTPLSTGKFTSVTGSDESAPFSGSTPGPMFPGEDFLMNAPMGLTFPTDLSGSKVVISIEPEPDNSPNPFLLKPLVADVPNSAATHTAMMMTNNTAATNPTGNATR